VLTGSTASSNNANPFQTITRQEIGIKLTVTPQINEGDAVQLSLQQEVSSLSGLSASDIITDKRTISTTVLVNDGQTIVLGGLIDDDIQESTEKVPILGDLPIIGRFFRADRTQKVKRNLMVFIRPTIVRDTNTLRGLSAEKYNYIRAQQIMMHDGGINLFPNAQAPVLPAWTGLDASPAGILPELEAKIDPKAEPNKP
jgi:general secretion pathway protein D